MALTLVLRLLFPFQSGGLAFATTGIAFSVGVIVGANSDAYDKSFYEAVVQVIPVLLLVLAVEARFFRVNLLSFKELQAAFEAEMKKALGENPSLRDVFRAAIVIQGGPSVGYIQQRFLMVLALAVLIAGEVIAFLVLGQPDLESDALQGVVLGALFAGLGAVAIAALTGPMAADGLLRQAPKEAGEKQETGTEKQETGTGMG